MNIDLGLRRSFPWLFIVDVSHAILGADFLTNFSLQVDLRHRRLVETVTSLSVNPFFFVAPAEHVSVAVAAFSDPFDLLSKFPALTKTPDYHGLFFTLSSTELRPWENRSTLEPVVCLQNV